MTTAKYFKSQLLKIASMNSIYLTEIQVHWFMYQFHRYFIQEHNINIIDEEPITSFHSIKYKSCWTERDKNKQIKKNVNINTFVPFDKLSIENEDVRLNTFEYVFKYLLSEIKKLGLDYERANTLICVLIGSDKHYGISRIGLSSDFSNDERTLTFDIMRIK